MKRVLSCSGVGVGHVARRQEEFQVLRVLKFLDSDLHSGWRVRSGLDIVSFRFREWNHALVVFQILMDFHLSERLRSADIMSLCHSLSCKQATSQGMP